MAMMRMMLICLSHGAAFPPKKHPLANERGGGRCGSIIRRIYGYAHAATPHAVTPFLHGISVPKSSSPRSPPLHQQFYKAGGQRGPEIARGTEHTRTREHCTFHSLGLPCCMGCTACPLTRDRGIGIGTANTPPISPPIRTTRRLITTWLS
jgi:hypothetical protein